MNLMRNFGQKQGPVKRLDFKTGPRDYPPRYTLERNKIMLSNEDRNTLLAIGRAIWPFAVLVLIMVAVLVVEAITEWGAR